MYFIVACIATSVTIFGVMIGLDRTWMPRWDMNVMGWSYGLVVVSGFLSAFSFISVTVYTLTRKYELLAQEQQHVTKDSQASKAQRPMIPKV